MSQLTTSHYGLSIISLMLISSISFAHEAENNGCDGYQQNVERELTLLSEQTTAMPTSLDIDTPYTLSLIPQNTVKLLAEPHRLSLDDASYAVIIPLDLKQSGDYRISISTEGWIDVVEKIANSDQYQVVASNDFGGRFECDVLRKLVDYSLDKDKHYFLQLSGATASSIKAVITSINPK